MKVAVISFEFEGNTFSLTRAGHGEFSRRLLAFGADVLPAIEGRALALTGGCDVLRQAGAELLPIVAAYGGSGGAVEDAFFDEIHAAIRDGLSGAGSLDGVYLALHGAMICESRPDPEGDILALVRGIVGKGVPIAASLDLHANVTQQKADNADILVGYETYPHDDVYSTGERAARLLVRTIRGEISPKLAIRRINAFVPVIGGATAEGQPMGEVRKLAREMEAAGEALCVSYFPVQPWLDLADIGICGLAVTDGDDAGAQAVATRIVTEMWNRRNDFYLPERDADDAVLAARNLPGPVILVDSPDCVGGGSSGDLPQVLDALMRFAPDLPSAILMVDPQAVETAIAAGVDATVQVTVGAGKDKRFGAPVPVEAQVERIGDGRFSYDGGPMAGPSGNMGPCVVLRHRELRILVASFPTYDYGDEQYRSMGIDWRQLRIAVFKNPMNFRNLLGPGIAFVGVDGKGPTAARLERLDWHVKQRPFWPCDDFEAPPFM
ncbi:M81 family metallopeptidase [Stappia sp.]|uniref:M81 family metallopeptidase n=1 Tax=Stappia sp. TaxID=1870903 RepID=UPI003A99F6F8